MFIELRNKIANIKMSNLKWLWKYTASFIIPLLGLFSIGIISSLIGVYSALVTKKIVDIATAATRVSEVLPVALTYILLTLTGIILNILSSVLSINTLEKLSMSIRIRCFKKINMAVWPEINRYHSGDLLTRITSDVSIVANGVINIFSGIFALIAQFVFSITVLYSFDRILAVVVVLLGPVTVILIRIIGRKLIKIYTKLQETESRFREFIQETIANIVVVKSFQTEEQNIKKLESLHSDRFRWILKRNKLSIASSGTLSLGYSFGYVFAFIWGACGIVLKTITYGTLMAYLQLVSRVQAPIIALAQSIPQVIYMFASVVRLKEIDDLEEEFVNDTPQNIERISLKLENVEFSYHHSNEENAYNIILKDISMDIKSGEIVSVTGFSGAGKTTLIRLLLALIYPSRGGITYYEDNGNSYIASKGTRNFLSYIPQGNTLVSGTVYENVTFGAQSFSDEEINGVLKTACAFDFINKLPDKMNTRIGEKGIGLSEGQAQRIAIARALLRKRPLLILDEATSALDRNTEIELFNNIKNLANAPACLIITHREYALDISSKIYNLNEKTLNRIK